jgi:membrane-bound lytic murein transglycosylase D
MISIFSVLVIGCYSPKISIADKVNGEGDGAIPRTIPVGADVLSTDSVFREEESAGEMPDAASSIDNAGASASGKNEIGEQSSLDAALDLTETAREYWVDGDVEKSLEALDQAYGLIAGVECGGDPKLIQQKEDMRFLISRRILEIYASRHTAAKGTHKAIPLTMNKYVEREIELFKNEERRFFIDSHKRSGKFRGDIVKALKEAGLPEELSWLPLIESGFKVNALSRSRALGPWQFIPSTGYKFGLTRTNWIDERMDPAKSTAAAIAYLKELHAIFGDWATVLAAYNCGEGTVLRAIRRQKIDYLDNFWDLYERLPAETARYYPRFLAVLAILKDPARYDMVLEKSDPPRQFEVVTVQKQLHLKTIAENLAVSFEELADLNPELRRHVTPASSYALKVPAGKGQIVLASLEKVKAWSIPKREYVFHRVRRGENLSLLALRYRTSIRAIEDSNKLRRTQLLQVGQKLKIPLKGT